MRALLALGLFVATWLLWSGIYTSLLLALGGLSCAAVLVLARRTGFFDPNVYALHLVPRLVPYSIWLGGEVVKANLAVARIVLSRRPDIQPTWVTLDVRHLPPVSQAIFANSVTLTPASVSVDVENGEIRAHCLTAASAADLRGGEMLRRVARLGGR